MTAVCYQPHVLAIDNFINICSADGATAAARIVVDGCGAVLLAADGLLKLCPRQALTTIGPTMRSQPAPSVSEESESTNEN